MPWQWLQCSFHSTQIACTCTSVFYHYSWSLCFAFRDCYWHSCCRCVSAWSWFDWASSCLDPCSSPFSWKEGSCRDCAPLTFIHCLRMYFKGLLESNFRLIGPSPIENVGNLRGHFELWNNQESSKGKMYIRLTFATILVDQENQIRLLGREEKLIVSHAMQWYRWRLHSVKTLLGLIKSPNLYSKMVLHSILKSWFLSRLSV